MRKCVFLCIFLCLVSSLAMAEEITVAGAANVQFTLEELKAAFTKETGVEVKTIIGSSGKLTSQIENGAPFDVFMSADEDFPKRLYKDGITIGAPKIYAYGALVLWTLKDVDLSQGLGILKDSTFRKIAIGLPKAAPYGRQAVNAMKYNHLYSDIESKLVYGESIAQVNQFITTQAADVGFTAKSVVLAPNMKGKGRWVDVDPKAYSPIAQAVVILKFAKHNELAAQKFYDFLFSPEAQEIFKKYGYALP
ncbi:MAG: molybdate ABC transporter substrate-binding protein [Candidatus Omnitrophota bacterium]